MSTRQTIASAVLDAQKFLSERSAPPNEANTCDWVIRPMLLASGYENFEISSQVGDVSNRFPDYTLLPGTSHTWYLEAKTWSSALDASHVDQAMNYAHSNGSRWVVLTNGREWRLYDDQILGKSQDRLVATAQLSDTESIEKFLIGISKDSIQAQKINEFANEVRVRDFVLREIDDPQSPLITAILKVVRTSLSASQISGQTVVDILNAARSPVATSQEPTGDEVRASQSFERAPRNSERTFHLQCFGKGGIKAVGVFSDGVLVILKGSRIAGRPVRSWEQKFKNQVQPHVLSGTLVRAGELFELKRDLSFKSPSAGSCFVLGRASNGWMHWVDERGVPLNELCPRSQFEMGA